MKDTANAKDIVQETFLKLYNRVCNNRVVASGSDKLSIKPLLSTMVHNESINFFRRKKKMTFVSVENTNHLESILFLCGEEQFDSSKMEINMKREEYKRVAQAVSCLPEEQQLLLKLRFECGLSFLEISELEGGSINTWLGRMRYALKNLRKLLNIQIKESEEE